MSVYGFLVVRRVLAAAAAVVAVAATVTIWMPWVEVTIGSRSASGVRVGVRVADIDDPICATATLTGADLAAVDADAAVLSPAGGVVVNDSMLPTMLGFPSIAVWVTVLAFGAFAAALIDRPSPTVAAIVVWAMFFPTAHRRTVALVDGDPNAAITASSGIGLRLLSGPLVWSAVIVAATAAFVAWWNHHLEAPRCTRPDSSTANDDTPIVHRTPIASFADRHQSDRRLTRQTSPSTDGEG